MSKRLDSRALEPWIEKLVEAQTRLERERYLCEAGMQLDGVRAIGVWRELRVASELKLALTSHLGEHDRLPTADQVRAVIEGQLGAAGLSQVQILGSSLAEEAPAVALVGEDLAEESLDALEAILTLAQTLEAGSEESAVDSIRSLFEDLD